MCLGIPGRITEIDETTAKADVAGTRREVSLRLIDGVGVGDYVIVHAGFAIEKLDTEKALETMRLIDEVTRG
ncbi:MAG: HypC/HybG/HupF family hydrogenase formation chaperone [Thermodesulfobacteriota bacterium]